jgi:hypothetical protein
VTASLTRSLATCGVWAYAVVLHAYPPALRREFGESMLQAFRDLTRDACRRSGLAGLLRLWIVTLIDTSASLITSYRRDANPMAVPALLCGATYALLLTAAIAYGALNFAQFYEPPSYTRFNGNAGHDETLLLAGYLDALDGELGRYRTYVRGANVVLALMLGVVAGLFGVVQRSVWHGAALFATAVVLTAGSLELMPTIWFPLDRHPVGFVWLMATPLGLFTSIIVWLIGRVSLSRSHILT